MRSVVKWLAATGLAVWGMSALAGYLPPRLRLLLLFSITFGLLAGWSAGVFAVEFHVRRTRWTAVIAFALTAAGLVNQTVTSYRQLQAAARARVEDDPQQLLALRFLESAMQDDPALQRRYLEERARLHPTFGDYLAARLASVAWLPPPWPGLIWGLETILGGLAATLMFQRPLRRPEPQTASTKSEGSDESQASAS